MNGLLEAGKALPHRWHVRSSRPVEKGKTVTELGTMGKAVWPCRMPISDGWRAGRRVESAGSVVLGLRAGGRLIRCTNRKRSRDPGSLPRDHRPRSDGARRKKAIVIDGPGRNLPVYDFE